MDALVINTIKEKMREEVKKAKINQSHRLGASNNNNKNRPIVLKFARYKTGYKIFKNKKNKKLKGKNISVTKSLTKNRMEALKKAREGRSFENVWTSKRKTLYEDVSKGNKIIEIKQGMF